MPDPAGFPTAGELDLGAIMSALADPHRRRVVAELARMDEAVEVQCSSFALPLARSTQTHLFKVLSDSGLVTCIEHRNHRGVALRRDVIDARFPGLLDILRSDVASASP